MAYDLDRLYDRVTIEAGHIDVLVANTGGGNFSRSAPSPKPRPTTPSAAT
jgi:hypothetical protein